MAAFTYLVKGVIYNSKVFIRFNNGSALVVIVAVQWL
jgi:hypothetical protein